MGRMGKGIKKRGEKGVGERGEGREDVERGEAERGQGGESVERGVGRGDMWRSTTIHMF